MSLNFMVAITVHSDFGDQENKIWQFPLFPQIFAMHEVTGPDAMILVFWMLIFKLSFFTLLSQPHQVPF